jgi:hypothetical protein
MKSLLAFLTLTLVFLVTSCENRPNNSTALDEQAKTELNQRDLNAGQPAPKISWSLERDNLIKRFKLQNDRSVSFFMYVFVEGVSDPIGYYQVNKVSSVNSQLTNPEQIVDDPYKYQSGGLILPSPAEDGSYGTNGDAVFGFTPEEIYIEHNMKYIASTVPLSFTKPVNRLSVINVQTAAQLKKMMDKIR